MARYNRLSSLLLTLIISASSAVVAGVVTDAAHYQPCPLLNAYFPPPTINATSPDIQLLSSKFTSIFDDLVQSGSSDDFGTITPNTTTFSIVMFSGASNSSGSPVFFEYHHTAPLSGATQNVTADTVFPAGTLTQLFTVYTWLAKMGDRDWNTPITQFLPDLEEKAQPLGISWDDVTIGSLAGHMSGLPREVDACQVGVPCDWQQFRDAISGATPIFLPDTTPIFSNAAFQLLSFAISNTSSASKADSFDTVFSEKILQPLAMSNSALLSNNTATTVFSGGVNSSTVGSSASQGLLTTTADLALAGRAMLSSRLIPASVTRRWLQPIADTSNLRNSVGRPWEVYHAGRYANSSILDVYMKSGTIGSYSSYFGLNVDFDVGFAILAHDAGGKGAPDLNVYADIVSGALGQLPALAVGQMAQRFAGSYGSSAGGGDVAMFNISSNPGLAVEALVLNGTDLRLEAARLAGIEPANLDFKLYPTNVRTDAFQQFVVVLQDKAAPVDADTPTCITWMDAGALPGLVSRLVFRVDGEGSAWSVEFPELGKSMDRDGVRRRP